jgi:hypothetical protein
MTINSRTLSTSVFAALTIMLLTLFAGCGSPDDSKQYDAGANGKQITIEKGDSFNIRMLVNFQVGAQWQIVELDSNIVEQMGPPMGMAQIANGGLARLYNYNYMFRAKSKGRTSLVMELIKPGEKDPLDKFAVTVVVK